MKLVFPTYYKKFKCIADKCKDSCCIAGWEIDIDENSLKKYNSVTGELGQKLKNNIILDSTPHFKLNNNNICPFLTNKKLCELYLNLGETSLCTICSEHPRYYEFFKNIKEGGIGICCEEAARIILSETEAFSTYEIDIPYVESDDYNSELFDYLSKTRLKIIKFLENENLPIFSRIKDVLNYSRTIQQNIDFNLLDDEEIFEVNTNTELDFKEILQFYLKLEPNNQSWYSELKNKIEIYSEYEKNYNEFNKQNTQISKYLQNISIYFIWRYFLKGVFDEDILSKVKLMVTSIIVINYLFFCKWLENKSISLDDCIDITKKYSEEVEYSYENLFKLAQSSYELEIFDTEFLIKNL